MGWASVLKLQAAPTRFYKPCDCVSSKSCYAVKVLFGFLLIQLLSQIVKLIVSVVHWLGIMTLTVCFFIPFWSAWNEDTYPLHPPLPPLLSCPPGPLPHSPARCPSCQGETKLYWSHILETRIIHVVQAERETR